MGYYVFFSRWKHSTIQVPFCKDFGRRLRTTSTVCFTSFFLLVAAFVAFILTSGTVLEGWQAGLSFVGFIAITWIPSLIVRPERYIKLLAAGADGIEFSVRNADYAIMLQRSNGITSPIKESTTKDNDDGQAFAT